MKGLKALAEFRCLTLITVLAVLGATLARAAEPLTYDPAKIKKEMKKLDGPTTVGGYLCKQLVRTWEDGSLAQARLAADTKIQGLTIPKDTMVWFYPGGKQIRRMWLSRPLTIQGVPCQGGGMGKSDTVFYPGGKLECAFLQEPATIQGLPLKKSGLCPVYLYENGKLKQGTLDREAEAGGKKYARNLTLFLAEDGKVVKTEPMPTKMQVIKELFTKKPKPAVKEAAAGSVAGPAGAAAAKRIGVYDSRAVTVAYAGSKLNNHYIQGLMKQKEQAEAAGDAEKVKAIKAEAEEHQYRFHLQGFSTAPVDDILEKIKEKLPEIQKQAGVEALVSKWDEGRLAQTKDAERVDVTPQLVDAFQPAEKSRRWAEDIQKHKPMPLEEAKRYFKEHPEK